MTETSATLPTLADLRDYVAEMLCQFDELLVGAFPVTERLLVQGNSVCGVSFCLHGPRRVQFRAIWEAERDTIWFYDCTGARAGRTRLLESPQLESLEQLAAQLN